MTDKKLLITGASGGMGRATALMAAGRGINVTLLDLNAEKLEAVASECRAKGVAVDCHMLDISSADAIADFVAAIGNAPQFNATIHTAGLSPQMAAWEKIIQVDLVGTVTFVEALRPMIKSGGCSVVIASMSGHMVPPNPAVDSLLENPLVDDLYSKVEALPDHPLSNAGMAYAYSKKALLTYVKANAQAWGKEGKRLVSLSPGLIDTPMGQLEADSDKDGYAYMRGLIALVRDGNPEEIASAALFLASDEASYISGTDLLVDGGFVGTFLSSRAQG